MNSFKAFRIHQSGGNISARFEDLTLDALSPGEVVIEVQYSDINYKDALAATGAGRILRRYPLVGAALHAREFLELRDRRPVSVGNPEPSRVGRPDSSNETTFIGSQAFTADHEQQRARQNHFCEVIAPHQ